jgi:hypothetical protein
LEEHQERYLPFHLYKEPAQECAGTGKKHPVGKNNADNQLITIKNGKTFAYQEYLRGKSREPQDK